MDLFEQVCRILTVLFSIAAIPYLLVLFSQIEREVHLTKGTDKRIGYLLVFLFLVLLINAILSLAISTGALYNELAGVDSDLAWASRLRSLFFSIANYLTAYSFYKLRHDNYLNKKGK